MDKKRIFEIDLNDDEEISEETLVELDNGKGDGEDE